MKILIAAYSRVQLDTFLRNHPDLNPADVVRVTSVLDLAVSDNRMLYWLPNAGERMETKYGNHAQEICDYWFSHPSYSRLIYEVTEGQVLGIEPFALMEEIPCPR